MSININSSHAVKLTKRIPKLKTLVISFLQLLRIFERKKLLYRRAMYSSKVGQGTVNIKKCQSTRHSIFYQFNFYIFFIAIYVFKFRLDRYVCLRHLPKIIKKIHKIIFYFLSPFPNPDYKH